MLDQVAPRSQLGNEYTKLYCEKGGENCGRWQDDTRNSRSRRGNTKVAENRYCRLSLNSSISSAVPGKATRLGKTIATCPTNQHLPRRLTSQEESSSL